MAAASETSTAGPDGSAGGGTQRYLDTASSEPLHPAAREVLAAALERGWADPRRLHGPGHDARALLDNARAVTAEALGVRATEVSFATSGTDAVHRGLLGLASARTGAGPGRGRIVASAVEHAAVRHAARWWAGEADGADRSDGSDSEDGADDEVGADALGRVDVEALAGAVAARPCGAVALQSANHEVGTVQDVERLTLPDEVPLFVDACASMGRLPLPGGAWSALAGSAHKWGGPAGVGVLVVRHGARWRTPFPLDDRVDERVAGFENIPAALAAAAALRAVVEEREQLNARHRAWIDRIRAVAADLPDAEVVGDPDRRLPHLMTFSCLYLPGDELVHALAARGFGVASGSACSASTLEPSHVLAAIGALTHGNVRVSLARDTSEHDVERFCAVLPEVVAGLRAS